VRASLRRARRAECLCTELHGTARQPRKGARDGGQPKCRSSRVGHAPRLTVGAGDSSLAMYARALLAGGMCGDGVQSLLEARTTADAAQTDTDGAAGRRWARRCLRLQCLPLQRRAAG